jgi:hypothetical protein
LQAALDLHKSHSRKDTSKDIGKVNSRSPDISEDKHLATSYKTTLCTWNEKGKCRNGRQCRFAHGEAELRVTSTPHVDLRANETSKRQISPISIILSKSDDKSGECLDEPMKVQPTATRMTLQQSLLEKARAQSGQSLTAEGLHLQYPRFDNPGKVSVPESLDEQDKDFQFQAEWLRQAITMLRPTPSFFDQPMHIEPEVAAYRSTWSQNGITRLSF